MTGTEDRGPKTENGVPHVELRDASRWYGNVVAVNAITVSLASGITGLLGPNGAGKSTVLHMIAGLLSPSAGQVLIDGEHRTVVQIVPGPPVRPLILRQSRREDEAGP